MFFSQVYLPRGENPVSMLLGRNGQGGGGRFLVSVGGTPVLTASLTCVSSLLFFFLLAVSSLRFSALFISHVQERVRGRRFHPPLCIELDNFLTGRYSDFIET